MTKKDYVQIAAVIKNMFAEIIDGEAKKDWIIDLFSEMLIKDNPDFDKDKFTQAILD